MIPTFPGNHRHRGATLLITVLIVGAVALVIGISIALRSIGDLDAAERTTALLRSLAVADGCLEDTLTHLWGDATYGAVPVTLTFGGGTCTAKVTRDALKPMLTIRLRAQAGRSIRNVRATVSTANHRLRLTAWDLE